MLIYLDRYLAINKGEDDFLNPYNVHRLVLVALLVSTKYLDDSYTSLCRMARIGGVTQSELCMIELDFLFKINFELYVTPTLYKKFENELNGILNPDQKTAFLMGLHKRLGKDSPITTVFARNRLFDKNILKQIFSFGVEQKKEHVKQIKPICEPAAEASAFKGVKMTY